MERLQLQKYIFLSFLYKYTSQDFVENFSQVWKNFSYYEYKFKYLNVN